MYISPRLNLIKLLALITLTDTSTLLVLLNKFVSTHEANRLYCHHAGSLDINSTKDHMHAPQKCYSESSKCVPCETKMIFVTPSNYGSHAFTEVQ